MHTMNTKWMMNSSKKFLTSNVNDLPFTGGDKGDGGWSRGI